MGQPFTNYIHLSRLLPSLNLGLSGALTNWLQFAGSTNFGLCLYGTPTVAGTNTGTITITDVGDNSSFSVPFSVTVATNGLAYGLGPLVISSTNQYTGGTNVYTGRPPSLAQAAAPSNSFTMRFYYQTLPSFAWPELGAATNWPAVGTIVPYLRAGSAGNYPGGDGTSTNTASLDIVYRPVWPGLASDGLSPLPVLSAGQTLTTPPSGSGLTAVRNQDSVLVIYQQSIATNSVVTNQPLNSVVLYDPTTEKKSSLVTQGLGSLPASVLADSQFGLSYFPNLPPNLINRVWFDASDTNLVLTGQFVADSVAGDYLELNVLSADDQAALNGLCSPTDKQYGAWIIAVANLCAQEYTFWEDPKRPGSYVINTNDTVTKYAGDLLAVTNSDTAVDSYALSATGPGSGYITYIIANDLDPNLAGNLVSMAIARVTTNLFPGHLVVVNSDSASPFSQLITFQHTADLAGMTANYTYDWRIEAPGANDTQPTTSETTWNQLVQANPGPVYTLGASGVQGMSDNWVAMRYGYTNSQGNLVWSPFVDQFAPGWIKRATQNLDPIAGETQDLYQNPANTTASIIALAGARWNGNVPLNAASLTNNGLIQLYETVLNEGKSLSINSSPGINYGPANQALLLAAGYLNDLYTTLGNDAWANAQNPTIEIGTDNATYGNIATSQFVFEGEEPNLLEQNLALLRGRDDSLSPGVDVPPVYNHLWWNYTYGLAAGEVMYALNYNITDLNHDSVVNAADAAIMYPQGHGDAYGDYLTALMNYYELLMNPNFDWVPQSEIVSILGAPVQVNYQDEQKFAASAAALARTGRQVFDLTWREGYVPGTANGWGAFSTSHAGTYTYLDNQSNTVPITRYWGLDHWAARVGQVTYWNWVVGNSILPPKDINPNDSGIEIVDRTTVQDLQELPTTMTALQNDLDNANAGFTPLGLAQNAIPFDINPAQVTGANPQTHFEQIYARAVQALNNAVTAFNAAQNVTADLRQQQNSLTDLQNAVTQQELSYNDQLIELFGTPYPEDLVTGQAWYQGYTGPDTIHYMYVDGPPTNTYGGILPDPMTTQSFQVDIQNFPASWFSSTYNNFDFIKQSVAPSYASTNYITFNIGPDGFIKPAGWTERASVGSIQTAVSAMNAAEDKLRAACSQAVQDKQALDKAMQLFDAENATNTIDVGLQQDITTKQKNINRIQTDFNDYNEDVVVAQANVLNVLSYVQIPYTYSTPGLNIASVWNYPGLIIGAVATLAYAGLSAGQDSAFHTSTTDANKLQNDILNYSQELAVNQNNENILNGVQNLGQLENTVQNDLAVINQAQDAVSGAQGNYNTLLSQGSRVVQERLTFRQHTAAQVQGYTVANSAFLVFQNEDLERYTTLFNLAQEYAWMAAQAYDYETGLLGTPAGQSILNQIISSSALGVVQNGQPQVSGTGTGDPGLANALAEMYADFEVLKGRLGFNNPDGYSTTVSLRQEDYRINTNSTGDNNWKQVLQGGLRPDLLADTDVKNNCLQIDDGSGAAVPGIELTFSTTITDGENLFGQIYGPGDHNFSSSSFATKIFSVGVDLDGYVGMDNPVASGGVTPPDPTLSPYGLGATPYVYLIPCGADSMRSPPLGDTSIIRTWNVDDVAIPLPYNIGASDFSGAPFYQAADSLTEPLFSVRKHQAFRPVSDLGDFTTSIYGGGALQRSQFTNQRLIGRSIWNSKWKLIIPGKTLLANPNVGLARFINSVNDIHLYFVTYSYSGN